ncbi:MAG TPA: phosphoribosylanthranilate isomerase [Pyrinomonadaceae bacterium]|jgi:phosphoribosylanthranilate isomerase|nr:phosphoribosylanthranilate isomerase [Pyrinomonadaceae bacterium]
MTFIKICGITNIDDARAAVAAGADALGFNFYNPSPRYIPPPVAREIVEQLPSSILTVGVFVNEDTPESVKKIAGEAGVTAFQLHGDESPAYCRELADRYVIKTLTVSGDFDIQMVQDYDVNAIMLDTKDILLRGGTGRVFDWSVAREVNKVVPKLFLAGGLSPENITEAIELVQPYAVDACSALEDRPGIKNHERMRAFVELARSVKP